MNATAFYRSFSRMPIQNRLGNLAVTLNRIADSLERHQNRDGTSGFVQEAMWFIEWLGNEVKPEQTEQIANLQRKLGRWRQDWERIWDSEKDCLVCQAQARAWSEKVLGWAGAR